MLAPGLPGIVAPKTAGRIIANMFKQIDLEDTGNGGMGNEMARNNGRLCLTGSHCTFEEVMPQIQRFIDAGANVIPIVSHTIMTTDTRFGQSEDWQKTAEGYNRQ